TPKTDGPNGRPTLDRAPSPAGAHRLLALGLQPVTSGHRLLGLGLRPSRAAIGSWPLVIGRQSSVIRHPSSVIPLPVHVWKYAWWISSPTRWQASCTPSRKVVRPWPKISATSM